MNSSLIHPNKSTSGELNRPRSACGPLTMNSSLMATISTSQIPMDLVLQAQHKKVSELSPSSPLYTPTNICSSRNFAWRSLSFAQRSSRKPPGATPRVARRNPSDFTNAPTSPGARLTSPGASPLDQVQFNHKIPPGEPILAARRRPTGLRSRAQLPRNPPGDGTRVARRHCPDLPLLAVSWLPPGETPVGRQAPHQKQVSGLH